MTVLATDALSALETLRRTEPPGERVLSVYLDVSPGAVFGRSYLLAFRDARRRLRQELPTAEQDPFDRAADRIDRYLDGAFEPEGLGLAAFAAPEDGYFYAAALPRAPRPDLVWDERPLLTPLAALVDDQERVAVALFDKKRARLFTVFLGRVEEARELVDDLAPKHHSGGWHLLSQTRFQRHHEETVAAHAKHAAGLLMELHRRRPFDRLLLGGPEEAVAVLRQHLPRPLRARLAGELALELFAGEEQVLRAALAEGEAIERAEEERAVLELLEAATTPRAALGLGPTLAALNEGRVHRLFIADGFAPLGRECRECEALVAGVGRCPTCGGETQTPGSFRDRVVARALAQGATVETVSGSAADLLALHDGLAAWTRFGRAGPSGE
jgi:peptide subunit release factor 1 (eRF1)